jgi:hypothetical protein
MMALAFASFPSWLAAQADFASTALKPGDFVHVTTASGLKVSGRVSEIAPQRLRLNGFEFEPESRLLIERRGDSVKDGAFKGLLIGVAVTAVIAAANGTDMNDIPALLIYFAPPHALWGAAIDWARTGRTTVFRGSDAGRAIPNQRAVRQLTVPF